MLKTPPGKVNMTGKNKSPHLEQRNDDDDKANLSKEISLEVVSKLLHEREFGGVRPSCSFATVIASWRSVSLKGDTINVVFNQRVTLGM